MTIKNWLEQSNVKMLDQQLLLSFVINKPKEWLLAHDDYELTKAELNKLDGLAKRRQKSEPLAYIVSHKEFYRRDFFVTSNVLIPRPETEQLVEYCLNYPAKKVLDVGTGSGCIAISLKLEKPTLNVMACDISESALKIAKQNWNKLKLKGQDIKFVKSNLLDNINDKFDVIIANLPYLDESWQTSPETKFEPKSALFAKDNGLYLIKKLINTAPKYLNNNGILILELDPRSVEQINMCCDNYNIIHKKPFILVLQLAADR